MNNDNGKPRGDVSAELAELIARTGGELKAILDQHVTVLDESIRSKYAEDVARAVQRVVRQQPVDNRVSIDPLLFSRIINVLAVVEANELVDTNHLMDQLITDARRPAQSVQPTDGRVVHGAEHGVRRPRGPLSAVDWWRQ